jgi:hypothetical protein
MTEGRIFTVRERSCPAPGLRSLIPERKIVCNQTSPVSGRKRCPCFSALAVGGVPAGCGRHRPLNPGFKRAFSSAFICCNLSGCLLISPNVHGNPLTTTDVVDVAHGHFSFVIPAETCAGLEPGLVSGRGTGAGRYLASCSKDYLDPGSASGTTDRRPGWRRGIFTVNSH